MGEMIHHDARRMLELLEQIAQLNNAIEDLTQRSAMAQRIRSIPGFGIISSAELAGEIGTLERDTKSLECRWRQLGRTHGHVSPTAKSCPGDPGDCRDFLLSLVP